MNRKQMISIAAISLGILVFTLAFNFLYFRQIDARPSSNKHPSFVRYVDFSFSQDIKSVGGVTYDNKDAPGEIKISGKKIRYTHDSLFSKDTEHTLQLNDIVSSSGSKLSIIHKFTPVYMDFDDVPEDLQKESIQKSSSGQIDDPFFNNYFPMQNENFQIENPKNDENDNKGLYVTFLQEVFDYDTNTKQPIPDAEAEKLREEVFAYIRKLGGKPEKYTIHYANEYLESKYHRTHLE